MSDTTASAPRTKIRSALQSNCNVSSLDGVLKICESIDKCLVDLQRANDLFEGGAPRRAYVTLVTPEYRWGAVAWLRSLRTVTDRPAFLLATREIDIPDDIPNVYTIIVPVLYDNRSAIPSEGFRYFLSKLWAFALLSLDRVFYVDADCLFIKSADELFEEDGFLASPDYVLHREEKKFNAGMMVFNPSSDFRDRIFTKTFEIGSLDDQEMLNVILRDEVRFIDEKYNLLRHFRYFGNISPNNDVRIIHFIIKKPWMCPYRESADAMLIDLDDLWTSYLSPDERLELISEWRRSIFHQVERNRFEGDVAKAERRIKKRIRKIKLAGRFQLAAIVALAVAVLAKTFLR